MMEQSDILDRAIDAALALATERPWRQVSLREIAERAGIDFAALYAAAPSKPLLLLRLSLGSTGRRWRPRRPHPTTSTTVCSTQRWPASRRWRRTAWR